MEFCTWEPSDGAGAGHVVRLLIESVVQTAEKTMLRIMAENAARIA